MTHKPWMILNVKCSHFMTIKGRMKYLPITCVLFCVLLSADKAAENYCFLVLRAIFCFLIRNQPIFYFFKKCTKHVAAVLSEVILLQGEKELGENQKVPVFPCMFVGHQTTFLLLLLIMKWLFHTTIRLSCRILPLVVSAVCQKEMKHTQKKGSEVTGTSDEKP